MYLRAINILTLIASIALLVAMSIEILYSTEFAQFSALFSWATFGVCLIFCIDFIMLTINDKHPIRYLKRNFFILLLSIPYHTIISTTGIEVGHTLNMAMGGVVMLRAILALYITLRWLIERRITRLIWAYMATVCVSTYFAALLFYEFEAPVNRSVHSFGDALWWAWMNLTTVGAEIFPVTAIGKAICVILPVLGTAMFPVFTVYITSWYNRHSSKGVQ